MFAKHFQVETNWTALKSAITINLKMYHINNYCQV